MLSQTPQDDVKPVTSPPTPSQPIDMALNHGTYCSQACLDVLKKYNSNTSLRLFPSLENTALKNAVSKLVGVSPQHIFLHNGSGPLLKLCIPHLIETRIKASVGRIAKHVLQRRGYPIITPRLTYFKVPVGASRQKLTYEMLPLDASNGFRLDPAHIAEKLEKGDGLVYLANPNNPTGNVLITREQLVPLMTRFPETMFFVDEAYVEYLSPEQHRVFADLVPHHPNLLVMRSFSFAYGLGAMRIGFILANPSLVEEWEKKVTPHRINTISEEMAIAALEDQAHLEFVRTEMARERRILIDAMRKLQGLEVYESDTNFFLCRLRNGKSGKQIQKALLERGFKVKVFEPLPTETYEDYFRITVGTNDENAGLLKALQDIWR